MTDHTAYSPSTLAAMSRLGNADDDVPNALPDVSIGSLLAMTQQDAADRIAALEAENNRRAGIIHDQDAHILALEAQLAAAKAGRVTVKALVWELRANTKGTYYSAFDPVLGRVVEASDEDGCAAIDHDRRNRILAAITLSPAPAADLVQVLQSEFASIKAALQDPVAVHANMLRGTIAKLSVEQIIHLYGVDALCKALAPVIVREAPAADPVAEAARVLLDNDEMEYDHRPGCEDDDPTIGESHV